VVLLHTLAREDDRERSTPGAPPGFRTPVPAKEGLGSGIVIDTSGLILTNDHVLTGADVIHVRTRDGDDLEATVIGRDPVTDLALVRVANPAVLMRSFFGMIISYFVTEMIIANSVVSKLMPRDSAEAYAEIYLHGILKESQ